MDSSDSPPYSSPDSPANAASVELPLLQPEFAAPLKIGRCPAKSQIIDPKTLEPTNCSIPKIDVTNPRVFGEQLTIKPFPISREDEIIGRNSKFSLKLETPEPKPDLDLRMKFNRLTTFDLVLNGRPVEMSLNPRKCGGKGRTGLCFKYTF